MEISFLCIVIFFNFNLQVIDRVVKQCETRDNLKKQVQQLENQRSRLLEEHDSLQQKIQGHEIQWRTKIIEVNKLVNKVAK